MLESAVYTDAGSGSINEDYAEGANCRSGLQVFALADGLGGHGGGDIAASLAVKAVLDTAAEKAAASVPLLEKCFYEAQNCVVESQKNSGRRREMKATLTVLLCDERRIVWGHIGDSRIYHCRKGKVKSCTSDHSMAQMLVNSRKITREEQRHHEDRSLLLRAIGTSWEPNAGCQIDCKGIAPRKGDVFVMCSDGVWEWVSDSTLAQIACSTDAVEVIARRLVEEAFSAGKGTEMDNCTALVVRVC